MAEDQIDIPYDELLLVAQYRMSIPCNVATLLAIQSKPPVTRIYLALELNFFDLCLQFHSPANARYDYS